MLRRCIQLRVKAPHAVLGVAANATEAQIKERYKELARQLHPDMPGGNERKFQEINAAYSIMRMRAQARAPAASGSRARTMGRYRGEDDDGSGDLGGDDGGTKRQHRSYVDEEEEAELRAQARAAEEVRQMQSQTFAQMMWTMSTYELLMSLAALTATVMLSLHRRLDLTVGDRINFDDVHVEGEDRLMFNEPINLTEEQTLVRDTYHEVTSARTQTSHTKFYSLKEALMIYDSDRAHHRRVDAKPVSSDRVNEKRLLLESPVVARIDGTTQVTPYHNVSLKIKESVAARQWAHVDVGPAIMLMLEAARRVPKNDPAAYRVTTFEYRCDDGSEADAVPHVVVTVINDKFKPNSGRCQRIVISGFDGLQPDLVAKRKMQLRDGLVTEAQLEPLRLMFPVKDEGILPPSPDRDERTLVFDPPIKIPLTKA